MHRLCKKNRYFGIYLQFQFILLTLLHSLKENKIHHYQARTTESLTFHIFYFMWSHTVHQMFLQETFHNSWIWSFQNVSLAIHTIKTGSKYSSREFSCFLFFFLFLLIVVVLFCFGQCMLFTTAVEFTLFDQVTLCIYERTSSSLFDTEIFHETMQAGFSKKALQLQFDSGTHMVRGVP